MASTLSAVVRLKTFRHAPIDQTFAQQRTLSPIHLEYQRNLGVNGSMSISIMVEGKLWGALMARHVLDGTGLAGRLRRLALRYRGIVTAGETVTLRAWAQADEITHDVRAGDRLIATGTSHLSAPDRR